MSNLILPPGQRTPVQMTEKLCVLVHRSTKRILCLCYDDPFATGFEKLGYEKVEIKHAHEYDKWAKRIAEQSKVENEAQDLSYLEREGAVRSKLRNELRERLKHQTSGHARMVIQSALHCLETMENRRKRYRESFQFREAYEDTNKSAAEDLTRKIILNE